MQILNQSKYHLKADLSEILKEEQKPVLLTFYVEFEGLSSWLELFWMKFIDEHDCEIQYFFVNAEDQFILKQEYDISIYPTTLFFRKNTLLKKLEGGYSQEMLNEILENFLNK